MAAPGDPHYYYFRFRTVACWHIVSVNDVPVSIKPAAERQEWTVPINTLLRAGTNTLTFNFVPVWGEAYPAGAPNPEFAVRIDLVRYNLRTETDEDYTALHLAFDMETGHLAPVEQTSLGASRGQGRAVFGSTGRFTVEDGEYRDIYGPAVTSRVVTFDVTVPDDLSPLTWEGAPVLPGAEVLREELLAAYRDVHAALISGDAARVRQAYLPAWERTATVMHYRDVTEFMSVNDAAKKLAPTLPEGETLQPARFWPSPGEAQIFHAAEGRLAFILPSPLRWAAPATPDKTAVQSAVAFMRNPASGGLVVASVLYLV